jgi:hypothetical protein
VRRRLHRKVGGILRCLRWFGFGFHDGFVGDLRTLGLETLEFLDGAAVEALGLGLVVQEQTAPF